MRRFAFPIPGVFKELWLMQFKIFRGANEDLEKQIQGWLSKTVVNKIHYVTHANDGGMMYITVWWM